MSTLNDLDRESAEELDGFRHVLKPAQERVLAQMSARADEPFTRADYETVAHVSRSQAAYDLAELVKLGLVERLGSGRATRYRLSRPGAAGRRRKWTPERIRTELEDFCEELDEWPRSTAFKEAGRTDLYLAASRYGGIDHWAEELGFVEVEEPEVEEPEVDEPEPFAEPVATPRRNLGLVGAALAAVAALTVLTLALVGGDAVSVREQSQATATPPRASPDAAAAPVAERERPPAARRLELRLVAARGDSRLVVRRDSADGRLLWEGLLERGETLLFEGRLWLRLGTPGALVARLDGERLELPQRPGTVRVTDSGIRVLSTTEPAILVAAAPAAPSPSPPQSSPPSPPTGGGSPAPDPAPGPGSGPSPDPPPGD
jgi:hypothetical protein